MIRCTGSAANVSCSYIEENEALYQMDAGGIDWLSVAIALLVGTTTTAIYVFIGRVFGAVGERAEPADPEPTAAVKPARQDETAMGAPPETIVYEVPEPEPVPLMRPESADVEQISRQISEPARPPTVDPGTMTSTAKAGVHAREAAMGKWGE